MSHATMDREPQTAAAVDPRRHDLDALRAFAMLLGIALHASLSFIPFPWPAQDTRQNPAFGLLMAVVHGFRMPLFFLISGFFTMMLYRKRGLRSLLRQRTRRIALPCLLGLVTIVPLMHVVSDWATRRTGSAAVVDTSTLTGAIRAGDSAAIRRHLDAGADVNQEDPALGIPPLTWAVLKGDADAVSWLIERGADVNRGNLGDGNTPLHSAAFLGHDQIARILVERGADPQRRGTSGGLPIESTDAGHGVTSLLTGILGLPEPDVALLDEGRARVRRFLEEHGGAVTRSAGSRPLGQVVLDGYRGLLDSDRLEIETPWGRFHLVNTSVFEHLWFLWFLCWMVGFFSLAVWVGSRRAGDAGDGSGSRGFPPRRLLWILPLTLIPQWFMGWPTPGFGPDTSAGLIPMPHLLAYYLVFFAFGALYYDAHDDTGALGRRWLPLVLVGLLVAFPAGLASLGSREATAVAQVVYVWSMSLGMMGMFRRLLARERRWVRYLSDASYWLYLTHLPLIIAAQAFVSEWPLPLAVKFALIVGVVTGFLLVIYQAMVRYTWLGTLLNGPRTRARAVLAEPSRVAG